ncbi:MAG: PAS domain S-box protein [Proteobacteria bacterium]|nr:PAS domain S-box protein [Desulfobacula sp.]MBU3950847.1 PAS domain S-box protein [Pseudomonadota bacterium]MBU4130003.1 PAS domain S-box protein [Pseudomonadota bacterium]
MNWTQLYGFFSLISGMISAAIAIYLTHYRYKTSARQLSLLMAGVSVWSMGYGMEFLSPTLFLKLWWVRVEYIGAAWVGVLMFKFICSATGKAYPLKKQLDFIFLMVPVLTIFLAATNEFHGMMWHHAWLESNSAFQVVMYNRASGFWGYVAFSYGLLFWATLVLVKAFVSSRGVYRKQLTILLSGILVPWLCNVSYLFGFQTLRYLDLTPFSFMISGSLFAWGLLRYQLLNLIPLAHEAVMDGMGDPVIVLDMDDRVMEINTASANIFALKTFTPGQDAAQELFSDLFTLVDTHRKKTAIEVETDLKINNTVRQWHLRISPLLLSKGKQIGWLIVLRDITEQKQTESALRASEEKHRTMLEASPTPIVYYSEKGEVTYVNPAFTRVFGWDREELVGAPLDFVPENQEQATAEAVRRTYTNPAGNFDFITQRYTKSKSLLDVSINASLYRDKDGKQTRMVVNYTDITRIKKVEKELRFARDYVRSIIDSMPSILIGVDDKGMVTQWNLEAERMTGIPADHARKNPLDKVFSQLAGIIPDIFLAIKNQQVQRKEKMLLIIDTNKFVTDIIIYPILSGNTPGAVIRVDDISKRIKIEEMMVQSEKMMSVGGLAAGMAHEINNPLAGILQNAQVIRNRLSKPLPANIKAAQKQGISLDLIQGYMEDRGIFHMMDQVVSSGKRAARIVDNMLSFSRKSDSRRSSHYLHDMMEATLDLVRNDYNLKKKYDLRTMEILRKIEDDLPPVPCEKTKIQQVLFNILKNGAEAMSEAKVAFPRFVIRYFLERNMAAVEIGNNGPAIPEEIRKRIFEPFFTTKEVGIGTGLGLSVSYFIITENHNGQLTVESSPDKGTSFIIKLPI